MLLSLKTKGFHICICVEDDFICLCLDKSAKYNFRFKNYINVCMYKRLNVVIPFILSFA